MNIEKYKNLLFPALFIFPLLNHSLTSYYYGILAVLSVVLYLKNKIEFVKIEWFFVIPYLLIVVGGWNSSNVIEYLNILSINSISLLITIIFVLSYNKDFKLTIGLKIFTISNIVCCFIFLIYALTLLSFKELLDSNLNGSNYRQIIEKIPYFEINIIYYSLFIVISIIVLIEEIDYGKFNKRFVFIIIGLLLLLFNLILFSSKMAIISFSIFLIMFTYKKRRFINFYLLSIFISGILFIMFFNKNSFLLKRFVEPFYFLKLPNGLDYSSTSIRLGIYNCLKNVISQNFLFGVGTGDVFDSLNVCYLQYNTNAYENAKFGSHNNFLWYFISNGIFGFLAFITFCKHLIKKIIDSNEKYTIYIIVMFINMLTEDILIRQRGVILFYLLTIPFLIKLNKK